MSCRAVCKPFEEATSCGRVADSMADQAICTGHSAVLLAVVRPTNGGGYVR